MIPANDQYIKPIAEKLRDLSIYYPPEDQLECLIKLVAELAEKLEPAEVRGKEKP